MVTGPRAQKAKQWSWALRLACMQLHARTHRLCPHARAQASVMVLSAYETTANALHRKHMQLHACSH